MKSPAPTTTEKNKTNTIAMFAALLVGGLIFGYLITTGVFGGTQIGVTINTNDDLENGLQLHYTFDGSDVDLSSDTAEIKDRSGNGYDSDWENHSSTTAPGKIGQAISFDGVDDTIDGGDILDIPTTLTIAAWANPTAATVAETDYNDIIKKDNAYTISVRNGTIQYDVNASGWGWRGTGYVPPSNAWTHVALTYDGSTIRVYINGVFDTSASEVGSIADVGTCFAVGIEECVPTTHVFEGLIDDVRVYDRTLSASEITRLYGLGATTKIAKTITTNPDLESGLVGHWTFDGSMETIVEDKSSNTNDGYLSAGMSSTSAPRGGKIGQGLYFDGVDDAVDIQNDASLNFGASEALTISVWVKYSGANSSQSIYRSATAGEPRYFLERRVGGIMRFGAVNVGSGSVDSLFSLDDGAWHHVLTKREVDGTILLYVDSILHSSDPFLTSTLTDTEDYRIGGRQDDTEMFNGLIDDVRVYNRALSTSSIERLYGLGATTKIAKTITTNPDLENGLVGHWTFDGLDLIDNATDRSGSGNDGFLQGFTATTTRPGKIGQALDFDGTDDVVDTSDIPPSNSRTWAFWVNPDTWTENYGIMAKWEGGANDEWLISECVSSCSNNGIYLTVSDGSGSETQIGYATIPVNAWTHIAIQFNSGVFDVYENGELISDNGDFSTETSMNDGSLNVEIGSNHATSLLDGKMDDVRMYDRILSAAEILRLYQLGGGN